MSLPSLLGNVRVMKMSKVYFNCIHLGSNPWGFVPAAYSKGSEITIMKQYLHRVISLQGKNNS